MKKQMKLFTYLTKPFVLFMLLFAVGVGQMWGYSFNYPHLYFYNSGTEWTNEANKVMFFYYYHRDDGDEKQASQGFNMSKVDHTKLWYVCASENRGGSLSGFSYGFGATSDWPWEEGDNWSTRWTYMCNNYNHSGTSQTNLPYGTYLCTSSGADNLSVTTLDDDSEEYTPLNHTQTVKKYTRGDGEGSYTAASVNSGTVSISAYQMTGSGTASNEENSDEINTAGDTEASADAAYTGEVTVTASANTGYVFMGWYSSENGGTEDKLSSSSSYTYNAPNSTKTVYARFAEKLPVGKMLYLATNAKWRENSARFAAVFCNASIQQWENCSAVAGTDDMYSVSIPDGNWGCVIFCKMKNGSDEERVNKWDNRWCQTDDMYKTGLNNCVYITGDCSNNQRWGKYAQIPAIVGGMNNWDPVANQFSGSPLRLTMDLSAGHAYQFKLASGRDDYWYGHGASNNNDLTFAGQTNAETLSQGHRNMMFLTARAGTYTFEWDATNSKLTIIYPDTLHPSMDYVYMEKYSGWNSGNFSNIHYWDDSSNPLTAGSDDPKMTAYHNFKDKSLNYYIYPMLTDYPNFKAADGLNGGTGINHTDNMVATGHGGHYVYHNGSAWVWATFQVYIKLENQGADEGKKGTLGVPVAFNDTALSARISKPVKTNYDFGGYYTAAEGGGVQIIDANGDWKTNVSDYTADGVWIHAGDTTTLYALWTEHEYAITLSVSPAGAGTISPSSATAKYVTASSDITAAPSHGAWIFKEWQFSKTGEDYDVYVSDGETYHSTDPTIRILAQHNGTLTAVFEPRYTLVGSIYDDSGNGGMPGYSDYTVDFTVNSTSPTVNLTCVRKLDPNTTFKFQVHDRKRNKNLGNTPAGGYISDASLECSIQDRDIPFVATGHGNYTFTISAIRQDGDAYYPTVSVSGPSSHLVNLKWADVDIDGNWWKTSRETGGTVAAVTTESGDNYPIVNGQYVAAGGSITYTATPTTGYSFGGWWNGGDWNTKFSDTNPYTSSSISATEDVEGKFIENSTSVTLANDGNGKVQISSTDKTNTTCGVTTTRSLTAVPNAGYKFSSWDKSGDDITLSSTSTNPTTLTGLGSGLDEGQTVTANFEERYSIKGTMNGEAWGTTHTLSNIGTNAGSKDTCYVTMTLPANTTYEFAIYDEQTGGWYKASTVAVYNMTYTNHTNWGFGTDKTVNCGITTAGKGTYKFIFNITDKTVTVVYPTSYQVNYGASVGGSVTSVVDDDSHAVPNGGYVRSGGSVIYTAAAASGYTFVGWCNNDSYGDTFNTELSWTNSNVTETQNSFAKFKSTNFVIYRSGDKDDDPRAALDDVESYAGGTISETIEFRMKVRELDTWYTLCLPFTVSAVKVWEDGTYYDLVPFYRTGGKYYTGDYIIRTPEQTTDFPIADFDNWNDPTSPTGYLPSANTPYIIQWHHSYFAEDGGRYISFFGASGQTIPASFSAGSAPSSDNVVNVHGNNSMQIGSVAGAYLLENDYGSSGAWLRAEDVSEARTILPFECYILVNSPTRARYRAIRPGMATTDTPTGLETIISDDQQANKILINGQIYIIRDNKIYTIYGMEVQQ